MQGRAWLSKEVGKGMMTWDVVRATSSMVALPVAVASGPLNAAIDV